MYSRKKFKNKEVVDQSSTASISFWASGKQSTITYL